MRDDVASADRGKKILTGILIAANLFILVIAIITIPPNLGGASEKADALAAVESVPLVVAQEPEAAGTDAPTSSDTPDAKEESQTPEKPSIDLSTEERPDLEDFLWYTEDVFYNGVPVDAAIIDNVKYTTGGWKGLIIYDPDNDYGANAMEFLNVNIAGAEDDLSLTLDWYLIFIAGEGTSFDETDMEDTVFDGEWVGGGIRVSGAGTIQLRRLYDLNNKQYAIGTMDTPDGIPAFIALVRP
jgi:hypothetical protein